MGLLDTIRQQTRSAVRRVADVLDRRTHHRLTPNAITVVGLVAHLPIAWLIAVGQFYGAAALLVVFGLFDTLDGELARLQKRSSVSGMLLDASTDRMKETLLYSGVAYNLALSHHPASAALAAAALGASVCVSYVKAKGEAAVAASTAKIPHDKLNRMFKDGLLTFEIRITLLVIGLVINQLAIVAGVIAVFASVTAVQRLRRITKQLGHAAA